MTKRHLISYRGYIKTPDGARDNERDCIDIIDTPPFEFVERFEKCGVVVTRIYSITPEDKS